MKTFRTKQGAASIYVVVFSILLFSVIAVAFVSLISSESTKTQNDTLSAAARDASLAGIEDGKLAYIKYRDCKTGVTVDNCENIIKLYTENGNDCDVVSKILGRSDGGEVLITETANGVSATDQAYTCVTMNSSLPNYKAAMTASSSQRIIPLKIGPNDSINDVKKVTISWYSKTEAGSMPVAYSTFENKKFKFAPASEKITTPPILSVAFVQYPEGGIRLYANGNDNVDIEDSATSDYKHSNRGEIWLVPVDAKTSENHCKNGSIDSNGNCYIKNPINDNYNVFAYSNVHEDRYYNSPYAVACNEKSSSDYVCSATLDLPEPVGNASRLNGYSFLSVSIPYDQPDASIMVTMQRDDGGIINFYDVQTAIDSTGRASDIYYRTENRIEYDDISFPFTTNALEATGSGMRGEADTPTSGSTSGNISINKNFWATKNCWYTVKDKTYTCDGNEVK